ncbi:hypothetical protein PUN28_007644 [Cardiocondyla obscurior]|uniref:Uncharacterized protein n=1 Tax=Cardiocondyla obscurior TaxID=286306 RepID=A0AAW2G7F6_9HYME
MLIFNRNNDRIAISGRALSRFHNRLSEVGKTVASPLSPTVLSKPLFDCAGHLRNRSHASPRVQSTCTKNRANANARDRRLIARANYLGHLTESRYLILQTSLLSAVPHMRLNDASATYLFSQLYTVIFLFLFSFFFFLQSIPINFIFYISFFFSRFRKLVTMTLVRHRMLRTSLPHVIQFFAVTISAVLFFSAIISQCSVLRGPLSCNSLAQLSLGFNREFFFFIFTVPTNGRDNMRFTRTGNRSVPNDGHLQRLYYRAFTSVLHACTPCVLFLDERKGESNFAISSIVTSRNRNEALDKRECSSQVKRFSANRRCEARSSPNLQCQLFTHDCELL